MPPTSIQHSHFQGGGNRLEDPEVPVELETRLTQQKTDTQSEYEEVLFPAAPGARAYIPGAGSLLVISSEFASTLPAEAFVNVKARI